MRLRQVAFAARDLDPVVARLGALLDVTGSFNDAGVGVFGLRNAVMPVGDTFLEVVSPIQADTAAGRYMARRGGDCGYMVMVQTEDSDRDRRRAAELGVRVVWSIDLDDIRGTHLHPRDLGGALLSLDAPVPPVAWRWAGPHWQQQRASHVARALVGVEMQCEDPATVAQRWSALLGRAVESGPDNTFRIALDEGALRFVPGPPGADGVTAVEIAALDRAAEGNQVVVCGTQLRFV